MDRANYCFSGITWSGLCIDAITLTKSCISRGIYPSTVRAGLSIKYADGDSRHFSVQGEDSGQRILSGAREGIHQTHRCIVGCYHRNKGSYKTIDCILINFARNLLAMWKKREKHEKETDYQSLKLKKSYERFNETLLELHRIMDDTKRK